MKQAFDMSRFRMLALVLTVTVSAMPMLCGNACAMSFASPEVCADCACCAKTGHERTSGGCCRSQSELAPRFADAENCTCTQSPSNMPPVLPADPSQDRINPPRSHVQVTAESAVSSEVCGFGDLFLNMSQCKPPPAHLLCCVWRC